METRKYSKRTAPYQISNLRIKQPRLFFRKPFNVGKDNKTTRKSVKDVNKWIMNDHTYACLKHVAVSKIGTPSTSAVVLPKSRIITSSKPIDVPSSSINSISCEEPQIGFLSSEDEDEEPIITKMETNESLKKHRESISITNPNNANLRIKQPRLFFRKPFNARKDNKTTRKSVKDVNKWIMNDHTYACLKHVAVSKIRTPSTSAVVLPKSRIITSSKPIDVPSSSINFISCEEPQMGLLSSEDEDEEPIITKMETNESLKKHRDSISITNPTNARFDLHENTIILEDKFDERPSVIKINDYRMLSSNEFINDSLIEFYLKYWYTQKLSNEDRNRTYVFNTYFYTSLAKSFKTSDYPSHYTKSQIRHEKVKRWTKNVNIFEKDFVFIPIYENQHWFMAVICFPYLSGKVNMKDGTPVNAPDDTAGRYTPPPIHQNCDVDRIEADPNVEDLWLFDMASTANLLIKQGVDYETDVAVTKRSRKIQVKRPCILLFDSLSGGVNRAKITATLRNWLEQEYIVKYNGKKKDFSPQVIKGALLRLPQQPNYTDCGLFVIHYFKRFFERPIVDYTLPIRHLENWFSIDEVVKNCQKRSELQSIILTRMKEQGSILPDGMELPILDFTDPQNTRL